MARWRWIASVAAFAALMCVAAPAEAHDYNVSTFNELTTAVALAHESAENDRIFLAAGTYEPTYSGIADSMFDSSGGTLEIAGQGDATVLKCRADGFTTTWFKLPMAPGSSIHDLRFGQAGSNCKSGYPLLSVSGASVYDVSFVANGPVTAINAMAGNPVSISRVSITGDEYPGSNAISTDDNADVTVDRTAIKGMMRGFFSNLSATWKVRDSVVDLGTQDDSGANYPAGISLANNAGDSHITADLSNVTIAGSGPNARGIDLDSFHDVATPPLPTIGLTVRNSIIAMSGSGAHDLYCPNFSFDYSVETVTLDHVAASPATFVSSDCSAYTNTNPIDRATLPLLLGSDLKLTPGSSAIDAGAPAFVPAAGELDLAGNLRVFGSAVDLGAFEFGSSPPPAGGGSGGGGGGASTTPLTVKFGKLVGKLKVASKAKSLRIGTKKSKPRIPVTLSAASEVTFTLAQKPKSKKKKPKAVKGSVKLKLRAGQSYLTWTGKWGKKKLKPGKYILTARAPLLKLPVTLNVKFVR
jgi:hypothetical protein